MENGEISWQALEYEYKRKTPDWFWAVGIVAGAMVIISLLYKNFLFAIFIAIATFTIFMYAARKPQLINFLVDNKGVYVSNVLYSYQNLESFWIFDNGIKKKLVIKSEKILVPYITIPIPDDMDDEHLREFLLEHIREEEYEEGISEALVDKLGF